MGSRDDIVVVMHLKSGSLNYGCYALISYLNVYSSTVVVLLEVLNESYILWTYG